MKFKRFNIYAGAALHGMLTVALLVVVAMIAVRGSGSRSVEADSVTEARALDILRSLRSQITSEDAATRMQQLFPEGACFLYTLYGWAWVNLADNPAVRNEALAEMQRALSGQNSNAAIDPFRYDTQVRRGAFWLGQRNLLLGQYLSLNPPDTDLTTLTEEFHRNSEDYHEAIMENPVHQVESYDGMCWPADAAAGLVSLTIHDDLFGTSYSEALVTWKDYHSAHGWNGTVLPAGRLDAKTGQHIEPARGCANSLIIALLAECDPAYAAALYADYHKHFAISRGGFGMFREYPDQADGFQADVDSGPIIMGAGVTATGIGLAAARAVGDAAMERDIGDLSEMFGFPVKKINNGVETQRYLGGLLPIGDAFLAWGWSVPRPDKSLAGNARDLGNRVTFYAIVVATIALLLVQWVLEIWIVRRRLKRLN